MTEAIDVGDLEKRVPQVVQALRHGARFTVLYHGSPAFDIVPVSAQTGAELSAESDLPYRCPASGASEHGETASQHGEIGPVDPADALRRPPEEDSLYGAPPVGAFDPEAAIRHDDLLYR